MSHKCENGCHHVLGHHRGMMMVYEKRPTKNGGHHIHYYDKNGNLASSETYKDHPAKTELDMPMSSKPNKKNSMWNDKVK